MFYDNDSEEPSPSSADYLESPHEAKRRALKDKLKKEGVKDVEGKSDKELKNLKLALLKDQVKDDKKDDEPKNPGSIGTKTREQEIASQKLTADAKPSTEQMTKQGAQDEKAEEALKKDEAQGEDA